MFVASTARDKRAIASLVVVQHLQACPFAACPCLDAVRAPLFGSARPLPVLSAARRRRCRFVRSHSNRSSRGVLIPLGRGPVARAMALVGVAVLFSWYLVPVAGAVTRRRRTPTALRTPWFGFPALASPAKSAAKHRAAKRAHAKATPRAEHRSSRQVSQSTRRAVRKRSASSPRRVRGRGQAVPVVNDGWGVDSPGPPKSGPDPFAHAPTVDDTTGPGIGVSPLPERGAPPAGTLLTSDSDSAAPSGGASREDDLLGCDSEKPDFAKMNEDQIVACINKLLADAFSPKASSDTPATNDQPAGDDATAGDDQPAPASTPAAEDNPASGDGDGDAAPKVTAEVRAGLDHEAVQALEQALAPTPTPTPAPAPAAAPAVSAPSEAPAASASLPSEAPAASAPGVRAAGEAPAARAPGARAATEAPAATAPEASAPAEAPAAAESSPA